LTQIVQPQKYLEIPILCYYAKIYRCTF